MNSCVCEFCGSVVVDSSRARTRLLSLRLGSTSVSEVERRRLPDLGSWGGGISSTSSGLAVVVVVVVDVMVVGSWEGSWEACGWAEDCLSFLTGTIRTLAPTRCSGSSFEKALRRHFPRRNQLFASTRRCWHSRSC